MGVVFAASGQARPSLSGRDDRLRAFREWVTIIENIGTTGVAS